MSNERDSKGRYKKVLKKKRKRQYIDDEEWELIKQKRKND